MLVKTACVLLLVFAAAAAASRVSEAAITQDLINSIRASKAHWTPAMNKKFSSMSLEQAKSLVGIELTKIGRKAPAMAVNAAIPTEYDARQTPLGQCVHPVMDQAQCGSCWAFGATESLSDRFCFATQGAVDVVLSPQYLVSCDYLDHGCSGGNLNNVWRYLTMRGTTSDECTSYTSQSGSVESCPTTCDDGSAPVFYRTTGGYDVEGVEQIQNEIITNGPVEAAFYVYQDFFAYAGGVYTHVSGSLAGGHAVKIIGWGVDDASGTPYWLVQNSWGTGWGLEGLFKIKRGTNECGIESYIVTGMPNLSQVAVQNEAEVVVNDNRTVATINAIPNKLWTAGLNPRVFGMKLKAAKRLLGATRTPAHIKKVKDVKLRSLNLPDNFDWRSASTCVNGVKNQAQCGSCWAFGTTSAFADRTCLHDPSKMMRDFSPEELVDCDGSDSGCNGGYIESAYDFLAQNGAVSETCYPYTASAGQEGQCRETCVDGSEFQRTFVDSSSIQTFSDADSMMTDLYNNGPITVTFAVYQDFFSYRTGVYHHVHGGLAGYHAVEFVGYGVDAASGAPYWIVKNSWGPAWGENGYFRIRRGSDECEIEEDGVSAIPVM